MQSICSIFPHISMEATAVLCGLHLHIWVPELQRYSIVPSLHLAAKHHQENCTPHCGKNGCFGCFGCCCRESRCSADEIDSRKNLCSHLPDSPNRSHQTFQTGWDSDFSCASRTVRRKRRSAFAKFAKLEWNLPGCRNVIGKASLLVDALKASQRLRKKVSLQNTSWKQAIQQFHQQAT